MDLRVEKEDTPLGQKDVDHMVLNPEAIATKSTTTNAVQHATDADKSADQRIDARPNPAYCR